MSAPNPIPDVELCRLRRLGLSPAVIARRSPAKESAAVIRRRLERLGFNGRIVSRPGAVEEAVEMVKRGMVPITAAERAGANVYAVYSHLKRNKIAFRRGTSTPEHKSRSRRQILLANTPAAQRKAKRTQRRNAVRLAFGKFGLRCSSEAMKFCVARIRAGDTGPEALTLWLLHQLNQPGETRQ